MKSHYFEQVGGGTTSIILFSSYPDRVCLELDQKQMPDKVGVEESNPQETERSKVTPGGAERQRVLKNTR